MDRRVWWDTVCEVTKSRTQLKRLSIHTVKKENGNIWQGRGGGGREGKEKEDDEKVSLGKRTQKMQFEV